MFSVVNLFVKTLQLGSVAPPHGGVQSNLSAIRRRLLENGHQCQVIAVTRSSEIKAEPNVFHPNSAFELVRLLFSLRYEILHLHIGGNFTLRLALLALFCGLLPRSKKVLTFHSGGYASTPQGQAAKTMSLRGFAVRRFNKIVAVNREIAGLFAKYGVKPENIEIISPNVHRQPDESIEIPFEIRRFIENHSPVLLSVGLLETHYDLPLQIRAFKSVLKEFPNAGLLLVGSGNEEENLRKEIAAQKYSENILLAGDVPHEAVLHLIKRADALLRTTLFDGDAISIREALFLETPVIATDNKMRPEGVRLIKTGDAEDLQRAIIEILREGKRQKNSKPDDWSNIDRILQIYEELLNKKTAKQISSIRNPQSEIRN